MCVAFARECCVLPRPTDVSVIPFDSVVELFESLDVDGDGEITEDEFVEGVMKATLEDGCSPELIQVLRPVRVIARKIEQQSGSGSFVALPDNAQLDEVEL